MMLLIDVYRWYIYPHDGSINIMVDWCGSMTGVFVDGGHMDPSIWHTYGSVMGIENPSFLVVSYRLVWKRLVMTFGRHDVTTLWISRNIHSRRKIFQHPLSNTFELEVSCLKLLGSFWFKHQLIFAGIGKWVQYPMHLKSPLSSFKQLIL